MNMTFNAYSEEYLTLMKDMWNDILIDGASFPGEELYTDERFKQFAAEQSAVTGMFIDGELAGFYILHPNNIGRCSHVANASYIIAKEYRGRKLAAPLVKKSLEEAKELGFRGMQFNAVVSENKAAIHTYLKLGFEIVGTIPGGFRLKNGVFSDMYIMYRALK